MDIDMISIGKRIRERRNELKLTQTDIDRKCGIKSGALSQIEHGTRTPSVITFYALARVLNCDMEWLITGKSTNSEAHKIYEKEEGDVSCDYLINGCLIETDIRNNADETRLLNYYRLLSNNDKNEIKDLIDFKLYKEKQRKLQNELKSNNDN